MAKKCHFGCPLATGLNLGILGSEQDNNPKLLYGSVMAVFMGVEHGCKAVSFLVSKIMAKKAILAAHWAFWDRKKIRTPNYFPGIRMPHLWGYSMF